jgi:hypothetical protein
LLTCNLSFAVEENQQLKRKKIAIKKNRTDEEQKKKKEAKPKNLSNNKQFCSQCPTLKNTANKIIMN